MGCSESSKACKLFDVISRKIIISKDVIFDESCNSQSSPACPGNSFLFEMTDLNYQEDEIREGLKDETIEDGSEIEDIGKERVDERGSKDQITESALSKDDSIRRSKRITKKPTE